MRLGQRFLWAIKAIFIMSAIQLAIAVPLFGQSAYTPPKDSAERQAILDTLRQRVQKQHNLKVIFVVDYLKVNRGWAWIETSPQSPDGKNHYDPVAALMAKKDGRWRVAAIAYTEEDNPDSLGSPNFFKNLRSGFPEAPADIFPNK